ncbi:MAG: hypothetical protein ACR2JF_11305 [Iamia sp.]
MGSSLLPNPSTNATGKDTQAPPTPQRERVEPPIRPALQSDECFSRVEVRRYDWDQTYDAAGYRRLMLSYSGTQMMDEGARGSLLDDIESFINDEYDGHITRPLVVTLTTAVLTGS